MDNVHVLVLILSVLSLGVKGQNCDAAATCGECYAIQGCAWCLSASSDGNRCFDPLGGATCDNVENIDSSFVEDVLELTEDNQISLERANISLRVGDSQRLNISIRPAENFPLDLYMLVDISNSLNDVLETIRNSAETIAISINDISTRFQIGFGTFIDKLVPPYVSRVQLDLSINQGESACLLAMRCDRPISYTHDINLTNSAQAFDSQAGLINISTNADNPEGTLDAILQAVVCQEIVGWRDNARKILLIITDAVLHSAGDGRIGGIIRPSVSECLLTYDSELRRFTYASNTEYDYPSIEQIRQVLEENTVSPIFAIRQTDDIDQLAYYQNLAPMLNEQSEVVTLTADASNIIDAITTAYNNLVSQVALSFTLPDGISINYTANCPENTIISDDGLRCTNVSTNQVVTFDITVTLDKCDAFREQQLQEIMVNIPSYGQFVIAVEALCRCECERMIQENSSSCNFQGNFVCGVCECNDEWTGDDCTCSLAEIDSIACPVGLNNEECSGSGRGTCECGVCQCINPTSTRNTDSGQELYTVIAGGTFILREPGVRKGNSCECDNFRCPRNSDDHVCSLNGECVCDEMGMSRCVCGESDFGGFNYTGDWCQCNLAICYEQGPNIVYSPGSEPCNGNGVCDPCDINRPCACNSGFGSRYCIDSQQLRAGCTEERLCIACISNNVDFRSQCREQCNFDGDTEYVRLDEAQSSDYMISNTINGTTSRCFVSIPDPLCTHVYYSARNQSSVSTSSTSMQAIIHVEPRSPTCLSLEWYAIALILLACLIILGIVVLVIIKLIFLCLDYKELKKFQKEVAEADLSKNFNPLYQSPNVNYTNVAFGKE